MVAIPATMESATRLKCRNNVLLSTEGCRDQTAPFSFSLLFPLFLDSVIKEHGDSTTEVLFPRVLYCLPPEMSICINLIKGVTTRSCSLVNIF